MHKTILAMLLLAAAACGDEAPRPETADPDPDPSEQPEEPTCGRYEELVGDACRSVQVMGIEERDLSFERAGYRLHGTLTLPVSEGGYRPPVFVLVHGSGPNDRDETTRGNLGLGYGQEIRTFRMLADALADAGAAVFRYDKRSCFRENSEGRCPTPIASYVGDIGAMSVDDFIADLRSAVRAVATLPEVDGDDITVVGHSQGANFVPVVMANEPSVVAGVQLAGPSLPIDRVMVDQLRDFADYLEARGGNRSSIDALRSDADRFEDGLSRIRAGTWTEPSFEGSPIAFWRSWMDRTDRLEEEFTQVRQPILVLNGDLDFNVPPEHLERFREWAEAAGMNNATFALLPDVTHAFVTVTGGGRRLDPDFSPRALEELIDWHRAIAIPPRESAATSTGR